MRNKTKAVSGKTFWFFSVAFLISGILLSCDELENTVEVTADAGSNITATTGDEVTLDGTNSSVSEGDLNYQWNFKSTPSNSNASLNEATTATPYFTPDAEGDYVVELNVTAGDQHDSDQVTVSVSESTDLSGTIETDKTLTKQDKEPDYHITGNLFVNAKLTIEKGVTIYCNEDVSVRVSNDGTLVAEGSSDENIVITSSKTDENIRWKGLFIASSSSQNSIAHTKISYAGNSQFGKFDDFVDVPAAVGLYGDGKLKLSNTTITHSGGYGMYVRNGTIAEFSENTFANNASADLGVSLNQGGMIDENTSFGNKVEIFNSTSTQETGLVKLPEGIPYHVTGNLAIESELTINAGVHLNFDEDVIFDVKADGALLVNGTASENVHFTSTDSSETKRWKGIFIRSKSVKNSISYADISYAGNSEFGSFDDFVDVPAAIGLAKDAKLNINNTAMRVSGGYGMYIRNGELLSFEANSFRNNSQAGIGLSASQADKLDEASSFTNNGWNGAEIFETSVQEEVSWVNLKGDAAYHIIENLTIESGGLTINPGVKMEFDEHVKMDIKGDSYLSAAGTANEMITFTTSNEAGQIRWKGLRFISSNAQNKLDYVHINYGGGEKQNLSNFEDIKTAVGGRSDAQLTLTNSTIENSDNYAVYFQGSINAIESAEANNTFQNNPGGVYTAK